MRARLAILIPTYNRPDEVEHLLRTLAADPATHASDVVVQVSDNASPGPTVERVRALQAEFPTIDLRLHVQETNTGALGNIHWLVERGPEAKHLWLFGDDDVPLPGAVGDVLAALEGRDLHVLHLPHRFDNPDGSVHLASPCPEHLQLFDSGRELLLAYTQWLSFLTACVVEREALRKAMRDAATTNAWAPHIWYAVAGRDGQCAVVPRTLVVGSTEISWADRLTQFLTTEIIAAYDDGMHLVVDEADYGLTLDGRYADGMCHDHWEHVPLEALIGAVERFPTSRELRGLLWKLARRANDTAAIARLDAAARAAGAAEDADRLIAAGEVHFAAGDLEAATNAFSAALRELPTSSTAWNDLGVVLHARFRPEAADAFAVALELDPSDDAARENVAALS